jgi:hypothetical protein
MNHKNTHTTPRIPPFLRDDFDPMGSIVAAKKKFQDKIDESHDNIAIIRNESEITNRLLREIIDTLNKLSIP